MVGVPLKVKRVLLKFRLSLRLSCFLLAEFDILLDFFLILVTLVRPSCRSTMCWPVSHTHPTELVIALATRHMVAACIFLNRFMAFRAGLGICHYPNYVFWLCWEFLFPLQRHRTVARQVRIGRTEHAERHAAFAIDGALKMIRGLFKTILTPFLRAPLYRIIQIRVTFAELFPVQILLARCRQKLQVQRMTKYHVATLLHAFRICLKIFTLDWSLGMVLPTRSAESMPALKCKFFWAKFLIAA